MSRIDIDRLGGVAVRGEQYLNKKNQFELVYNKGRTWAGREVVLKILPNGLESSRYGFTVSRRVGKAVVRNRVKRLLREITRKVPLQTGWDIVFIARNTAAEADYTSLGNTVKKLLAKAGITMGGV